ncbi:MAG: hypothetical protein O2857_08450 [Planctomycetota bacterium]|nr:hypothetical protein [Planctomycetota bacterium]
MLIGLFILLSTNTSFAEEVQTRYIGSRLELFVDDWLIEKMEGARLHLNQPMAKGVAIDFDQPWEGSTSGYVTVFQDGALYRMYYRGSGNSPHQVTCYAESKDGILFTKPELGLFEFEGTKKNNIVWMGTGTHNFAPMMDANQDCDPDARYKALAGGGGGLVPFKSPDGIHWTQWKEKAVITRGAFDSQNLAFWDPVRKQYVDYHRGFREGKRDIMTATSPDFLTWTEPVWLEYPGVTPEHLYTNQITPYFRAPHILMGFPKRFVPDRRAVRHQHGGVSDGVFMTSRDGRSFKRWPEAFIRPGLQKQTWVNRNNMTAWGIVQTAPFIPDTPDDLSIYVSEGYYTGKSCQMRRYTLRMDGFVSVRAPMAGGEFVTRPFTFEGSEEAPNSGKPSELDSPVQIAKSQPLFGESSLVFSEASVLSLPGTKDLGKQATLAVHVKGMPSGHRRLFSAYNGGPTKPRELFFDVNSGGDIGPDGAIRFGYDGWKVMAKHAAVGDWSKEKDPDSVHHLAATWNDGEVKLYFDGKEIAVGGKPDSGSLTLELGGLRFGEDYPPTSLINEPFLGTCDDILVLRRVLAADEVKALAESGASAVLKLDKESGALYSIENTKENTLQDSLTADGNQSVKLGEVTRPGEVELTLNYSTSAAGSIRCEIQDEQGEPIPGFTLADCEELFGDDIERAVSWNGQREVKGLVGKKIRLRFKMKDADLYSIRFR